MELPRKFWEDLLAGGIAGAASRTFVSPLERIKIIYQIQTDVVPNVSLNRHQRGVWSALKNIFRTEGFAGYYKGNGTNVLRITPYSAVQYAAYETYKSWYFRLVNQFNPSGPPTAFSDIGRFISGAMAGITSVSLTYPLDLIRTRLTLSETRPKANGSLIWRCALEIVREEGGVRSLYRGLAPSLLGIAPYVAINFTSYEYLKIKLLTLLCRLKSANYISPFVKNNPYFNPNISEAESLAVFYAPPISMTSTSQAFRYELSNVAVMVCGGVAGAIAQSITYPLDMLRRRFQVHASSQISYRYTGLFDAVRTIYKEEGLFAFYKGMWPNLLKVVPTMAVSFLTYEASKKYFSLTTL